MKLLYALSKAHGSHLGADEDDAPWRALLPLAPHDEDLGGNSHLLRLRDPRDGAGRHGSCLRSSERISGFMVCVTGVSSRGPPAATARRACFSFKVCMYLNLQHDAIEQVRVLLFLSELAARPTLASAVFFLDRLSEEWLGNGVVGNGTTLSCVSGWMHTTQAAS